MRNGRRMALLCKGGPVALQVLFPMNQSAPDRGPALSGHSSGSFRRTRAVNKQQGPMGPVVRGGKWCGRALPRYGDGSGTLKREPIARRTALSTRIPAWISIVGGRSQSKRCRGRLAHPNAPNDAADARRQHVSGRRPTTSVQGCLKLVLTGILIGS